jgi:nucleotide-binding universal stress UspA family protein
MVTTVVIGLEPSGSARRACLSGIELAKRLDARIHLVTAFSDGALAGSRITPERRKAERALESMALRCDLIGRRITTHALPGRPAPAILDVANRVDADLIVVGNKGTRGARRVLGSVAGAVTRRAPCAVTVVDST